MALLLRVGLIDASQAPAFADVLARTLAIPDHGFDEDSLVGIVQAFGRGVERIANAGADIAAHNLAPLDPAERERRLAAWLEAMQPLACEAFALLFARRLEHLTRRRLAAPPEAADGSAELSVAFVDLCGSTAFMLRSSPGEIVALADDLYAAGQGIASRHDVAAGKFLGDGVMFLSADAGRLLAAATEAVATLGEHTPLRAGAGIARGPVTRRGGDWFGTPVNLAARLAELAAAGEILLDGGAQLPDDVTVSWRDVVLRGVAGRRSVAAFAPR